VEAFVLADHFLKHLARLSPSSDIRRCPEAGLRSDRRQDSRRSCHQERFRRAFPPCSSDHPSLTPHIDDALPLLVWSQQALLLSHPRQLVRDTQTCPDLRKAAGGTKHPGLKKLALIELGVEIQSGRHSSVREPFHSFVPLTQGSPPPPFVSFL
jgi:hypothetical protein